MRLICLKPDLSVVPFAGRLEKSRNGVSTLVFGYCEPPSALVLHNMYPPELYPMDEDSDTTNMFLCPRALGRPKGRNFMLLSHHDGRPDRDWLIAFSILLPQGFRGKPIQVPGNTHCLFLDNRRRAGRTSFCLEGFLHLEGGECAYISRIPRLGAELQTIFIETSREADQPMEIRCVEGDIRPEKQPMATPIRPHDTNYPPLPEDPTHTGPIQEEQQPPFTASRPPVPSQLAKPVIYEKKPLPEDLNFPAVEGAEVENGRFHSEHSDDLNNNTCGKAQSLLVS